MRRGMTPSEAALWVALRRKLKGVRFRRQQPLGGYIVDFVCHERRLVIEIDGPQHGCGYDVRRDSKLLELGYRTLRFWNEEMAFDPDWVLEVIEEWLADPALGIEGRTRPYD